MFGTMEGRVQQFAADYLGEHGYPRIHDDLEQFNMALNAYAQGNSVMSGNMCESLYREYYAQDPLRNMNTLDEFNIYHVEFMDRLSRAATRSADIVANDFRIGLAYNLQIHIAKVCSAKPSILSSVDAMRDSIIDYYNSLKFMPSRPRAAASSMNYNVRGRSTRYSRGRGQRHQYSHPQIEYKNSYGDGGSSRGGGRAPSRGRGGRGGRVDRGGRGGRDGGRGRGGGYTYTPKDELRCHKCHEKGHFIADCPQNNVYHVQHPTE